MARRKFNDCQYGPMQLRWLLRSRLAPGERLIGWGSAGERPGATSQLLLTALVLLPGIGHALFGLAHAGSKRLLVLTDRRLLVLGVNRAGVDRSGKGVRHDVALGLLSVRAEEPRFLGLSRNTKEVIEAQLRWPGQAHPIVVSVARGKLRSGRRLVEGLRMMAREAP